MKHPVYWFLISSGLIASTSLSFAQPTQATLGPSDSYNGNTANAEFSPKSTADTNGVIYSCNGDVSIAYAGKTTPLTSSCFSDSQGNLTFTGNGHSLCFDNINAGTNPGAINVGSNDKTLSISGFSLFSCSFCPPGTTGTGAIKAGGNATLSNNASVVFNKNYSTASGGAISCTNTGNTALLKFEGNSQLIFSDNTATTSGGAIYTNKLTINSGGLTLFSNNSVTNASPKGGAICLHDTNGECSLTANLGDIIFKGNTIITTGASPATKRNAINLGAAGKFTQLRAKEGFGIYFYDPIADAGTTDEIELNKTEGTTTYSGQIVFSGEKLTPEEQAIPDNLKSSFKQAIKLGSGSLILKEGVTVTANKVTQTGGTIVMDAGTALKASTETIALTNLEVNIASLGGGGSSNPAIVETTTANKTISITEVNLIDSSGNGYEYPIFSTTKPFTTIEAKTTTSTITAPTTNLTNYVPPTHYGYQGNWTVTWAKSNSDAIQTATFDWKQTGYNPNPERQGPLVPNTLWGSLSDVRAMQNLMDVSANSADYQRGLWVSGLANFLHKSGTETKRKFRHNSAGYVLGAFAKTPSEDIFSAAFCQLFGKDKDYLVAKNSSNIYAGSIYYQHSLFWSAWDRLLENTIGAQAPLVLNAQLTYSHTSNDMKTNMTQRYAPPKTTYSEIKGDWDNDCFGVELGATVPIESQYSSLFDMYSPFLKFQLVHAHQEDFKENSSTEGRYFESSNLTNLSMPIGVKFERFSDNDNASYNLTLAYAPDLVRSNPDCTTSLLVSPTTAVWLTKATNLARQAFIVRAGNHLSLSSNFEIFSQFSFELRGSSRTYNVDLGSKIQF
ncbi:Polymorphic membrane protein F,chlamydial polymorphic outer membrane protein repeat,Autotransporter beta-domain [Chlamydia poikilotherma]|uniref:Polymorphic membrane protein F,chlamydial polymorphic outer membrane protein repeat,Autotransporter beta-domain n=1 Tax=Chlamydia poikilotherma TaxID=1967783 RepID=A0A3B0PRY7_9CHLA|nr:autotransporter domain-containing protein [Chlamydia poikilotherma]SYX08771.1 Polymorphic membrane protein F,chlamydial polymorphic outer membrane protein repeat,Autotransporter beta-domain [Chlamydia poikilotherma]